MEPLPDRTVSAVTAITTVPQPGPMVLVGIGTVMERLLSLMASEAIATVMVQQRAPMGSVVGAIATEHIAAQMDLAAFVVIDAPEKDAPQSLEAW